MVMDFLQTFIFFGFFVVYSVNYVVLGIFEDDFNVAVWQSFEYL